MVIELLVGLLICCVLIELLCGYRTNKNKIMADDGFISLGISELAIFFSFLNHSIQRLKDKLSFAIISIYTGNGIHLIGSKWWI